MFPLIYHNLKAFTSNRLANLLNPILNYLTMDFKQSKIKQKALLIEGYKDTAEESLKLTREWASADND